MHRTLVIGATGVVGGQVLAQLVSAGYAVRALLRNPDAVRLAPDVEAVYGDLTLPETLDTCLDEIDSVFLVWCAPPGTIVPVLERIVKHARRIVFLSSPYKTAHPMFQRPQPNPITPIHAQIEQLLESSGRQWTFLRPGMFAANSKRWWASQIRAGARVRWPYLSARSAPIDERDIAAVAVRALLEDGHAGAEYFLTGPESLSHLEQLAIIGTALGRSLDIEEMSPDEARRDFPSGAINMLLQAWEGAMEAPPLISSTVEDVTGTPPRTFLDWATNNVAEFRA